MIAVKKYIFITIVVLIDDLKKEKDANGCLLVFSLSTLINKKGRKTVDSLGGKRLWSSLVKVKEWKNKVYLSSVMFRADESATFASLSLYRSLDEDSGETAKLFSMAVEQSRKNDHVTSNTSQQ